MPSRRAVVLLLLFSLTAVAAALFLPDRLVRKTVVVLLLAQAGLAWSADADTKPEGRLRAVLVGVAVSMVVTL